MAKMTFEESIAKLERAIIDAINCANKEVEYLNLSGLGKEDFEKGWLPPYARMIRVLNHGVRDVRYMRDHEHKWNESGFCWICGADGNA